MLEKNSYLDLCHKLYIQGCRYKIEEGAHIARGFADLGYEEFLILPGQKLLSLFTGVINNFPEDDRHSFFLVPSTKDLSNSIVQAGYVFISTMFEDQRDWSVIVQHCQTCKVIKKSARVFEEALLLILLEVFGKAKENLEIELPVLILASASPRRKELLTLAGYKFCVKEANINESTLPAEDAKMLVSRLALEKALNIANQYPDNLVIGADTVVVLDQEILGKPKDPLHAIEMLMRMQGRSHQVVSAFALVGKNAKIELVEVHESTVTFAKLTQQEIEEYVKSGEPLDKAGAYGAQGLGAKLIKSIEGSYTNVVGLNISALTEVLKTCQI